MDLTTLERALEDGAEDEIAIALASLEAESVEALIAGLERLIAFELENGREQYEVNGHRYRLAATLEVAAAGEPTPHTASAARRALSIYRDDLNDGEGATRSSLLALRASADDAAALQQAMHDAGGMENSVYLLEKALKRPEVKGDTVLQGRLRRAMARVFEARGDVERAFFEAMKAARKLPHEGLPIDEVYRLALETRRFTEAGAFFQDLGADAGLAPRARATMFNKLGALLEEEGANEAALRAYVSSLEQAHTRGARRRAERLAEALGVEITLPEARDDSLAPVRVPVETVQSLAPPPTLDRRTPPPASPSAVAPSSSSTPSATLSSTPSSTSSASQAAHDEAAPSGGASSQASRKARPTPRAAHSKRAMPTVVAARALADLPPPSSGSDSSGVFDDAPRARARALHNADHETPSADEPRHEDEAATRASSLNEHDVADDAIVDVRNAAEPESPLVKSAALPPGDRALAPPVDDDAPLPFDSIADVRPSDAPSMRQPSGDVAERTEVGPPPEIATATLAPAARTDAPARTDAAQGSSDAPRARLDDDKSASENRRRKKGRRGKAVRHATIALADTVDAPSSDAAAARPQPPIPPPVAVPPLPEVDARSPADVDDAGAEPSRPSTRLSRTVTDEEAWSPPRDASPRAVSVPAPVLTTAVERDPAPVGASTTEAAPPRPPRIEAVPAPVLVTPASVDEELAALPPLWEAAEPAEPSRVLPRLPTRDELLAHAQTLLDRHDVDDVEACLEVAARLKVLASGEPRVLRLAAHALKLSAPSGVLPSSAVEILLAEAPRHGDRSAALIRDVQEAMPPERRRSASSLWLAGARAAGHDVDLVHALLGDVAVDDAPAGPCFTLLESLLGDVKDVDRRDALLQRAWRAADKEPVRLDLQRRRITLLEDAGRSADALLAHAQLVLEHSGVDLLARSAARRAHANRATPEERARFLGRLGRKVQGGEAIDVLRELLEVRVGMEDRAGAEVTARELLQRVPGDARATQVLTDALHQDPARLDELVDLLRARAAAADNAPAAQRRAAQEALADALARAGRADDAVAALIEAARVAPDDSPLVERVLDRLEKLERIRDAVDLLEEIAARASRKSAARLLARAAALSRGLPTRRTKARELIERAAEAMPHDVVILELQADIVLEAGDVSAALTCLERIAADDIDAPMRARVHLRIGRLLEEHQQRGDDAMRRYRAAVEQDRSCREAWDALRRLARARGDRAQLVDALTGLAALEDGAARAATCRQLARIERDERNDPEAALRAYAAALEASPDDVESLQGYIGLLGVKLQGDADIDAVLAVPSPELVDAVRVVVQRAADVGARMGFGLRRLHALVLTQQGNRDAAQARFEALLDEKPDDLPTLLAFARFLGSVAARGRPDNDSRRLKLLESIVEHHSRALKPTIHVDVWGELVVLRADFGDRAGARHAARRCLLLVQSAEQPARLAEAISDRAVRAIVAALEGAPEDEAESGLLERALRLDLERALAPSERALLLEKLARLAASSRKDLVEARRLLDEAIKVDPDAWTARDALLDLELSSDDPVRALEKSRALIARERDPQRKAQLHIRLFRLQKKLRMSDDVAAAEVKAALELDPRNPEVIELAEKFFGDHKDARALDALLGQRLKQLDRSDVESRRVLLERIAQLRRWEQRDLRGAVDALEALSAIDPEAVKPREDAARVHAELGNTKDALAAWRAVLERDVTTSEAWRGMFSVLARAQMGDDAFAVGSTMVALEVADDDLTRTIRTLRPPFPRWPVGGADPIALRRRIAHPLERAVVRQLLEIVAARLLPRFGRPLAELGQVRRSPLLERHVPPSVWMAIRAATSLLGLRDVALYEADAAVADARRMPFVVLPSSEPAILIAPEVLKGGITPDRAFALGRAAAGLQPWAMLASVLEPVGVKRLLEGLVGAFLSTRDMEAPTVDLERHAQELKGALLGGLSAVDVDAVRTLLVPALRDWVAARTRLPLVEWSTGVGFTADRVGFLLTNDLPSAIRVVRQLHGRSAAGRAAVRELVLFSVAPAYLQARRELALALSDGTATPLFDLG